MKRHSQNHNLHLHNEPTYLGIPVQVVRGPLISEYLASIHKVINRALDDYSRVFAFRVDLRFPEGYCDAATQDNAAIRRFIASLKAKLENRNKTITHATRVRYVWCREYGKESLRPHYHVVFLLNYDSYCTIGRYEQGRDNLFNRLNNAWASALGITPEDGLGLVNHSGYGQYTWKLARGDVQGVQQFFHAVSYLGKAATKRWTDGIHAIGCSRA